MIYQQTKLLIWGLLSIALAVLLVVFIDYLPSSTDYTYHTQTISSKVNDRLRYIASQNEKIKRDINDSEFINFTNVVQPFKYPYFIYENNKLKFWSDYKVFPAYNKLIGKYKYKIFENDKGKFLISRKAFKANNGKFYEVYFLLPLKIQYEIENNYLKSGLNPEIFVHSNIVLSDVGIKDKYNIYSEQGDYLFSLEYSLDIENNHDRTLWLSITFLLFLVGVSLIGYFVYLLIIEYHSKELYEKAFLVAFCTLFSIRSLMLYFNFPYFLVEWDIFNPQLYAASIWSPTVGDLFLNHLFLLAIVTYFFNYYRKYHLFIAVEKLGEKSRILVSIFVIVAIQFALFFVWGTIKSIFHNSQEVLDITKNIDLNLIKIIFIIVFIFLSASFFIGSQIVARIFIKINPNLNDDYLSKMLLFTGLPIIFVWTFVNKLNIPVAFLGLVYFGLVVKYKLPKTVKLFRYNTYLYFFLTAFVCAVTGALAVYEVDSQRVINDKEKFSNSLLIENDVQGEFLLNEISDKIRNDGVVKSLLVSHLADKDLIIQKIRKIYLSNYFDKYEVNVKLYNVLGDNYGNVADNYHIYKRQFNKKQFQTPYPNLFYLGETSKNPVSKYVCFIDVEKDGIVVGYIVLDLKLKKVIPNSVYPELLVDSKFAESETPEDYSYAIFANNKLLYTYGDFNYTDRFNKLIYSKVKASKVQQENFNDVDYEHLLIRTSNDKIIIISSPEYPLFNIFSNFSFLLLVLIFTILFVIIVFSLYNNYTSKFQLSLSAKIQIYLNLAFFFPLFIVSIATLGIISADYKAYVNDSFLERAKRVRVNIADKLDQYIDKKIPKEEFNATLMDLAKYTESDINIYDTKGKLISTSQPSVFQLGLLSGLMNPEAYSKIVELKGRIMLLREQIGTFQFNSMYATIKSPESGEMLGVLSIPYYHSKQDIEKHLVEVLNNIINIFMMVFIVFLSISFFAVRTLTDPLNLITKKIKRTSFNDDNEAITWSSKDEIGLLVGAYNKMLLKLVESKRILSQNEKETAWREMAQQVAHEIKNPLTPMKLSIQHLQRAQKDGREDLPAMLERSLNSLLNQVDTLSDIATSFSAFAKMPIPKNEKFDLVKLLQRTIYLYNNHEQGDVSFETNLLVCPVVSDEQLMGRIISNLILNGLQSVTNDKLATIKVELVAQDTTWLLTITDNGSGIPEEIRHKVFLPNFSTKYNGSGIGLAVAKRGVEHAGGKIWFETETNQGTTFFIELPKTDE